MQARRTLARSLPPHVGANGGALAALRLCCQGGPLRAPTAAEWPWVKRTLREQAGAEAMQALHTKAVAPALSAFSTSIVLLRACRPGLFKTWRRITAKIRVLQL